MRKRDIFIVYPEYFDSKLTRREGRRVPLSLAVPNPRIDELISVAHKLGWRVSVEADAAYPRCWWNRRGRLIVEKGVMKKGKAVLTMARSLKGLREKQVVSS